MYILKQLWNRFLRTVIQDNRGEVEWWSWPFDLGGEEEEKNPYGALNPEQIDLTKKLGPYLTNQIGNEAPQYTGNFAAAYTPTEQETLDRQSRLSALNADWSKYYQPGEINPEVDANEWRNLNQKFYGNGFDPGIKALTEEQYAGPSSGGYWGSARANAVMNAYNTGVINPYKDIRSGLLKESYRNALNYGVGSSAINKTTSEIAVVPRAIQQFGLTSKYNEWVRTRPESLPYIEQALNFLGISTGTYKPEKPGLLEQLLPEIVKGASTAAGAAMFA